MFNLILAQVGGGGTGQILMMLAIFVVFYFFMIRPQQKKAADAKKFIDALKVGDRVVTSGGMHGTVTKADDLTVELEIARGMKATFDRSAINMESTRRIQAGVTEEKAS